MKGVCRTRQPGVPETGDYLTIESIPEDACIARCGDDPKCTGYEYHLRRSPRKCEIHWSAIDFALAADNVECKRKSTSPSRPSPSASPVPSPPPPMVRLVGACRSSRRCDRYSRPCHFPDCRSNAQDGCYLGEYDQGYESSQKCKAMCEADVRCTGYEYQPTSAKGPCERHKTPITYVVPATGGFECFVKNASALQL